MSGCAGRLVVWVSTVSAHEPSVSDVAVTSTSLTVPSATVASGCTDTSTVPSPPGAIAPVW